MKFVYLDTDEQETYSPLNKNFSINTLTQAQIHTIGQDLRSASYVNSFLSLRIPNPFLLAFLLLFLITPMMLIVVPPYPFSANFYSHPLPRRWASLMSDFEFLN